MDKDKWTILVVEDDVPLREAVVMKLQKEGFKVVPAGTAEDGILLLDSIQPDFIWLDMLLPGMSGLQFLEHLRENCVYKDIPVMIVSASTSSDKIKKAFELNVVSYMAKIDHPIKEIVEQVRAFFDNKKQGCGCS